MATEHAETPDQLGAARVDPRSLSDVVNMPHVKWMPGAVLLDSIDVKEGAPLVDGYKLGKFLGAGVQVRAVPDRAPPARRAVGLVVDPGTEPGPGALRRRRASACAPFH